MVVLKINNNNPQYPSIENEVEPQENYKQIALLERSSKWYVPVGQPLCIEHKALYY